MTNTSSPKEIMARAIYSVMPYDGPEGTTKPRWVPDGNSLKQDDARCYADTALTALEDAGMVVEDAGKIARLRNALIEAIPVIRNARDNPDASPWQVETRDRILSRMEAAIHASLDKREAEK